MRSPWALKVLAVTIAGLLAGCAADVQDEEETGTGEDEVQAMPEPRGEPAKYPFVLEHGFNASTTNTWAFYKVKEALEADGHRVYLSEVPPFQGPTARAGYLSKFVDRALRETGAPKVNIIAHSMGGLDARYLISSMGYGDRVASLTTIASPHRGTYVADVGLKLVNEGPVADALDFLGGLVAKRITSESLAQDVDLHAALVALAEKNAPEFDRKNPNDARVFYQSWAGVSSRIGIGDSSDVTACEGKLPRGRADFMEPRFKVGSVIVGHGFGFQSSHRPNDGLVTVESSKWGEFRGCVRADHLDEVGQPGHDEPNRTTGFDHRKWYRSIAYDLSARGY